jgi:hypothetical protein
VKKNIEALYDTKSFSKRKQILIIVFCSLFLMFGIYANLFYYQVKTPAYTICEIVSEKEDQEDNMLFYATFEYYVDGRRYRFKEDRLKYQYNVIGEKYVIKYDINNPKKKKIISYKPIFLEDEKTVLTKGTIKDIYYTRRSLFKKQSTYGVCFEYNIGEEIFKKRQAIEPGKYEKKYLDSLRSNKVMCDIEYWIDNPKRAIIII